MTVNYLHEALIRKGVPYLSAFDSEVAKKVEKHNKNCSAFWNRINHVILEREYDGKTKFPYEAVNLAHYLVK